MIDSPPWLRRPRFSEACLEAHIGPLHCLDVSAPLPRQQTRRENVARGRVRLGRQGLEERADFVGQQVSVPLDFIDRFTPRHGLPLSADVPGVRTDCSEPPASGWLGSCRSRRPPGRAGQ